jgi:DNA-binding protein H-NS
MKMIAAFVVVGLLVPSLAQAQGTEAAIEITRDVIRTERKAIVATNLALTEEQATAFWPVYNEYAEARRKIFDQRVQVIQKFAAEYETLTDEKAQELISEAFKFNRARVDLQRDWVKKFAKVLPSKQVLRFFQIESKMDAIIDFDLAKGIPLAK